jgi:hypothetical protein
MGFRVNFDETNAILLLSIAGAVTDKLMLEGYDLLRSCRKHFGECNYILDYTDATDISLSEETVRKIAEQPPNLSRTTFQVIVAPQDRMYKLARTFQSETSKTRPGFQVVRTMDEALMLLEAKPPTFLHIASAA